MYGLLSPVLFWVCFSIGVIFYFPPVSWRMLDWQSSFLSLPFLSFVVKWWQWWTLFPVSFGVYSNAGFVSCFLPDACFMLDCPILFGVCSNMGVSWFHLLLSNCLSLYIPTLTDIVLRQHHMCGLIVYMLLCLPQPSTTTYLDHIGTRGWEGTVVALHQFFCLSSMTTSTGAVLFWTWLV